MIKKIKIAVLFLVLAAFTSCTKENIIKLDVLLGYISWQQNKWDNAIIYFFNAQEKTNKPESKSYIDYALGSTYLMQNEDVSAMEKFSYANYEINDNELKSSMFYQTGILFFKSQQYKKAAQCFQKSLKLSPSKIDAKINYELSIKYLKQVKTKISVPDTFKDIETFDDNVFDSIILEYIEKKEKSKCRKEEMSELIYDY